MPPQGLFEAGIGPSANYPHDSIGTLTTTGRRNAFVSATNGGTYFARALWFKRRRSAMVLKVGFRCQSSQILEAAAEAEPEA